MGKGPRCSRVSCSQNSGIFACNSDPEDVVLSSWAQVSDGAWVVMTTCHFDVPWPRMYCKGEAAHDWHDWRRPWSVIVRGLKKGREPFDSDTC